jgi:hypothetical protein
MSQVIIFNNEKGGVAVCYPSGDLPIDVILTKDCPEGAVIVDKNVLPSGDDEHFFDAWELDGANITVSLEKAKAVQIKNVNNKARPEIAHRQTNTLSGIDNVLSDEEWLALLSKARSDIASASTTSDLLEAVVPIDEAIANNK